MKWSLLNNITNDKENSGCNVGQKESKQQVSNYLKVALILLGN